MCTYQSNIGWLWTTAITGDILLYSKSNPILIPEFHGAWSLANILASDSMLNDLEIQRSLHIEYRIMALKGSLKDIARVLQGANTTRQ